MPALIQRLNLVGLMLLCLSGASPVVEVSYEPDEGALVLLGCPSGSCQERPC